MKSKIIDLPKIIIIDENDKNIPTTSTIKETDKPFINPIKGEIITKLNRNLNKEKPDIYKEPHKESPFQQTNFSLLDNDHLSNEKVCSTVHQKTDEYSNTFFNTISYTNRDCSASHISYPIDIVYTTSHSSLHHYSNNIFETYDENHQDYNHLQTLIYKL
jgi:hypothetical protein